MKDLTQQNPTNKQSVTSKLAACAKQQVTPITSPPNSHYYTGVKAKVPCFTCILCGAGWTMLTDMCKHYDRWHVVSKCPWCGWDLIGPLAFHVKHVCIALPELEAEGALGGLERWQFDLSEPDNYVAEPFLQKNREVKHLQ